MLDELKQLQSEGLAALEALQSAEELQAWRSQHLGRNSALMQAFKQFGQLSKEERPQAGKLANEVKGALEAALETKQTALEQAGIAEALEGEVLDVTLPGRRQALGRLHPVTRTMREIQRIFAEMGFQVYRSRDVETEMVDDQDGGTLTGHIFEAFNLQPGQAAEGPAKDIDNRARLHGSGRGAF